MNCKVLAEVHLGAGGLLVAGQRPKKRDEEHLRQLMVRYQQADRAAVEELIEALSPLLAGYLGNSNIPSGDREDLLQDCWMRIHRARQTYRSCEPVLPWIFAVARYSRLDAYRRRRRRESHEVLMAKVPEQIARAAVLPNADVSEMLDQLPENQREILMMLKVAGLSLEEIATATSSSVGAVKQKVHRAYVKLRSLFQTN